jgi:hypothetical protein
LVFLVLLTMKFGRALIATAFLLGPKLLAAQNTVALQIQNNKAYGEYGTNLQGKAIAGIDLEILKKCKAKPRLSIGGHAGITMYGNRTYNATIVDGQGITRQAEIFEDDCYTNLGAQARYQLLKNHMLMPYASSSLTWQGFYSHADPVDKTVDFPTQFVWQGHSLVLGAGLGVRCNFLKAIVQSRYLNILPSLDISHSFFAGTTTAYRNFDMLSNKERVALQEATVKSAVIFSNWKFGFTWTW